MPASGKASTARCLSTSNWTELDVWLHIAEKALEAPSIYLAHGRELSARARMLAANDRGRRGRC